MKYIIYTLVFIMFAGCGTTRHNNLTQMDNYILYVSDSKKEIVLHDSKDIEYPKTIKFKQYMHFGDGILFYKLNDILGILNIPKGKKARVYVQSNNKMIKKDLSYSLGRFSNIIASSENNFVDFTISGFFILNNILTLRIYQKDIMLKEYKNINIKKLEDKINSNIYVTITLNSNKYKIKRDTVYKNEFNGILDSEKISAQPFSFQKASNYCVKNGYGILPKLYVFEHARRLGYINPPIGVSREFISGYLIDNINEKDKIPEDEMSIIIFNWDTGKYFSYSKEFKSDTNKFKNISFRCMKGE